MKSITAAIFCLFVQTAFSQQDTSWYKILNGKIDKYAVTLHLHKAGANYKGYYYYNSQQKPIYFNGDNPDDTIRIIAFSTLTDNELFTFTFQENQVKGEWKKNATTPALPFEATVASTYYTYVYTTESRKLRPNLTGSPEVSYSAASIWPAGKSTGINFLKKEIRNLFPEKAKGNEDIGTLLVREKNNVIKTYLKDYENDTEADIKEMPSAYAMEVEENVMICYAGGDLLSLAKFDFSYTGGAHGNYGTRFICFDLRQHKKIVLADIIPEEKESLLNQLLEKNFRNQYDLKPSDSLQDAGLFENKIAPNDNFYITGKGIGFNYVPYEIGPYAMGEINIFISYKDLGIKSPY